MILDLSADRVTGAGLDNLREQVELQELRIGGKSLNDAGMAHLAGPLDYARSASMVPRSLTPAWSRWVD